jgi:hypothetical protein
VREVRLTCDECGAVEIVRGHPLGDDFLDAQLHVLAEQVV